MCEVRARWERENIVEHVESRETDRRLSELVSRWQRRFPDSRIFDCNPGGYCYSLCPAITYPGRSTFPPLVAAERANCAPALAADDPCRRFRDKACASNSYLCPHAEVYVDHARCHPRDDLLAVLARESCSGFLYTWEGEAMPDKPYVSTNGDAAWCKLFADPPPECGGAPEAKAPPQTAGTFCARLSKTVEQEEMCIKAVTDPSWANRNAHTLWDVFPATDETGKPVNTIQQILGRAADRTFVKKR